MLRTLKFSLLLIPMISFALIACEYEPEAPGEEELTEEESLALEEDLPAPMADIQDMPPNIPYALPEISEEELEKFANINFRAGREDVDPEANFYEFQEIIEEGGLTTARYREIYVALEREPQLRVTMQELMDELHDN